MPSVMRLLLVLAAVVSHVEALRLFPGSRTPRLAQIVAMQVTDPVQLQKEVYAERARADQEEERADYMTRIADANEMTAGANAKTVEVYGELLVSLKKDNERQLVELAEFTIQFATRTVICAMLQLAKQGSNEPGGALFNDFLSNTVLDSKAGGKKLTKEYEDIYKQIRALAPFQTLKAKPDVSWVAILTGSYPVMNGDMHRLPKLKGEGLACGGDSLDQMFLHTFIVACLQNFLIVKSIPILPGMYADVAVLSADFSEEVGRVTNGVFVEATPDPRRSRGKKTVASS